MSSSPSATLTGLPSELRLLIYSFIGRPSGRVDFEIRPDFVTATRPSAIRPLDTRQTVASLSRTCRLIHTEIRDFIYEDIRAGISVTNRSVYRNDYKYSQELSPGLNYLGRLRYVNLTLVLDAVQGMEIQRATLVWLEDVLTILSLSDELEELEFQIRVIGSYATGPAWVEKQAERMREGSEKEGGRVGGKRKDRELDCAWRLLPSLRVAHVQF